MGVTLKNPASDAAATLTGQTVGGVALVTGTNLFATQIHPMPQGLVVQLLNTGGFIEPYISPTAAAVAYANLQALVYGMPGEDGFSAGEALARGVVGFLQQTIPSGYISVTSVDLYNYVGSDPGTQRHVWSANFRVRYEA